MRRWSPNRSNGLTTVGVPKALHPLGRGRRDRPGDHGQIRPQQRGRLHDGEVGLVVVGQREHPLAGREVQARDGEVPGVAGVGDEAGHVGVVGVEVEVVDAPVVPVDHHEPPAQRIQRAGEQLAGAPVADDEQERLAHPLDLAREVLQGQRLPEAAFLQQGQQRPDRVRPARPP